MGGSLTRSPVIERRGLYTVTLEQAHGLTFIHCDIHTLWSASIKRRLQSDFGQLLALSDDQTFYTLSCMDDHKHHKFLSLFGFTYAGLVACDGDLLRHLFKIRSTSNGH